MASVPDSPIPVSPGVETLATLAAEHQKRFGPDEMSVYHWLLALCRRHARMIEDLTPDVAAKDLPRCLEERLRASEAGGALSHQAVLDRASERTRACGRRQVNERDIAVAILSAAGYRLSEDLAAAPPVPVKSTPSEARPAGRPGGVAAVGAAGDPTTKRAWSPTPTLDKYGRDATRAAREGRLRPFIGRDAEVDLVIETLCRTSKPNPVLIGPAGIGKTAIVEGLAQRIVSGDVPEHLCGARIVEIAPSTLLAGASMMGEVEKRMQAVLSEARQEGLFLFIDEVHSLMGAGGAPGTGDMASLLKPALARGDLACIAATTDDEYRRFIEPDAALERRFQPIRVQELSAEQTQEVLSALSEELGRKRKVAIDDSVLDWLIRFSGEFLRNRYFPDKAVDLLEQTVAHAVANRKVGVTLDDARLVAERMVGMPVALEDRVSALSECLHHRGLLTAEDAQALQTRLQVTLRGLDLRPARANAVVLLTGPARNGSRSLAETIAETLYGGANRVVSIDFSRFTNPADLTMLLGAPPGYVGYADTIALHRVAQMPWCVLLCEGVDVGHPQARDVLRQGLSDGFITDAHSRRIFLSDTVVVMTADIGSPESHTVGFRHTTGSVQEDTRSAAVVTLGKEFVEECDLVISRVPENLEQANWVENSLLPDLAERYRRLGLDLLWDKTLVDWFKSHHRQQISTRDWERLVDEHLNAVLVGQLPSDGENVSRSVVVRHQDGEFTVEVLTDDTRRRHDAVRNRESQEVLREGGSVDEGIVRRAGNGTG